MTKAAPLIEPPSGTGEHQGGRQGGRRRRREARSSSTPILPWREVKNRLAPIEVLSEDQVEAIHQASLKVLANAGIKVLGADARGFYREAGADIDEGEMIVRFAPELIEELLAKAPANFAIEARNPERSLEMGGNNIHFSSVNGPSFVNDLEKGRRAGNFEEFCDFIRLTQALDILHMAGGAPFEPLDLPVPSRHLDRAMASLTLSDKIFPISLLGARRAKDVMEMVAISRGLKLEDLKDRPMVYGGVNTNSPRQIDGPMGEGLIAMAEMGQPVVVTPFTLLGAMAPATLAGALTLQNAEALAGIALTQAVRPGAPVVYGGFTSNVDMKSGAPAFGTPEYAKACQATGQLTRRHSVPYRSSGTNASNCVDAQAAYESEMSLWGAVMGHANIINHAGGWLEGGLSASFEKLIVDAEMLQMMACYLDPIAVDSDALALEAIGEVQPGGHFFGATHTLARYENAFYEPLVSDWRNFETWSDDGAKTATERALGIWKEMLANYEEPAMEPAIKEELIAFVAHRKEDIAENPEGL